MKTIGDSIAEFRTLRGYSSRTWRRLSVVVPLVHGAMAVFFLAWLHNGAIALGFIVTGAYTELQVLRWKAETDICWKRQIRSLQEIAREENQQGK